MSTRPFSPPEWRTPPNGMPPQAVPQAPMPAASVRSHRRRSWVPVGIVLAVLLCLLGGGVALVGLASTTGKHAADTAPPPYIPPASPSAGATTSTPSVQGTTAAAKPAVPPPAPTTPPPAPKPTIADGTYTVGEDFPAGTYRVGGAPAECYWSIYKSGTNQATIINNHLGAGNLRVTLKAGQDFETSNCGTWTWVKP